MAAKKKSIRIIGCCGQNRLREHESTSVSEVAANFATTRSTIYKWRKEAYWPGSVTPEPFSVCLRALDNARIKAGLESAYGYRARFRERFQSIVDSAATVDNDVIIPDSAAQARAFKKRKKKELPSQPPVEKPVFPPLKFDPPKRSGNLTQDIEAFRDFELQLRRAMRSSLEQRDHKAFKSLADTYTRTIKVLSDVTKQLVAVKQQRGELIALENAKAMTAEVILKLLTNVDELINSTIEVFKTFELEAYNAAEIDSLSLSDALIEKAHQWRERVAVELSQELQ